MPITYRFPRIKKRGTQPRIKPRIRPLKQPPVDTSLASYLQGLSAFGGTTLEQLVDGAAAKIGIFFDEAQYVVWFDFGYEKTIIDRVILNPLTAIFIDGIQHDMRPETAQGDVVKREALRSMGWLVVVLNWKDLLIDPINTVRRVMYAT